MTSTHGFLQPLSFPTHIVLSMLSYDLRDNFTIASTGNLIIGIHQMFNVIIRSVHFYFLCFTDNIYLARALHQQ